MIVHHHTFSWAYLILFIVRITRTSYKVSARSFIEICSKNDWTRSWRASTFSSYAENFKNHSTYFTLSHGIVFMPSAPTISWEGSECLQRTVTFSGGTKSGWQGCDVVEIILADPQWRDKFAEKLQGGSSSTTRKEISVPFGSNCEKLTDKSSSSGEQNNGLRRDKADGSSLCEKKQESPLRHPCKICSYQWVCQKVKLKYASLHEKWKYKSTS